jgi:diguanylate cyclase (GGDEF)-like protein/PAS domain S-box-containing protein
MLRFYYCIQNDHDLRLVVLAALICVTASFAAVMLLRHARSAAAAPRRVWLGAAGVTSGFGIWATHFVAMIGYDPGVVVGYALGLTAASLAVAVASTSLGFGLALTGRRPAMRVLAAVAVGAGIASMHYLGMAAVEFPGEFRWAADYVSASILFAIVPVAPALTLALDRRDVRSAIGAALLLVLAIVLLHFTGMAAITVIPSHEAANGATLLSPIAMAIAVAATAFGVLAFGILAALLSGRARAAIVASEREFGVLVRGISDCAIYMLDADGHVTSWNAGAQRLKGYAESEALGLDIAAFHSAEDRAAGTARRGLDAARDHGRFETEGWRYRKDGSRFWAHVSIEAVHDEDGGFHGFAKITRDMTRHKAHQDALETMTGNLNAALSNMQQGLCLFGPDDRLVVSNNRVGEIFGIAPGECPAGMPFTDVFRLGLAKRAGGDVAPALLDEVIARHRAIIGQPGGGTVIVPFTEACTLSISHRPTAEGGWVTTFDDITERRRAEQRIEHMALHDGLTGLPNRVHYNERLAAEIQRAERAGSRLGVIGIDLDRFKEINDAHGHGLGDLVLKALADRMQAVLEGGEMVARFGGDEFAAFKPFREEHEIADFVARMERCLNETIDLDGVTVIPGASIGIAVYPEDGRSQAQILNNADLAMYRAKDTVGRQICYYEQGMDEAARARRVIANDLREAIPRGEFSLAYQVQRSVSTEEVTGYEALLRWRHARDGWVSPQEFIPIAEESGEIIRIGEWVLRTACMEAAQWEQPYRVAVNLSAVQLMHVDLINIVTLALLDSGLPATRLELEITETAFVADKQRALHILRQIKALGVSIAIDDFGTGYSSLDTLNSFPFDKIKIDRSFLLESETSHQARAIVRAVLALGRSLEVPVLAEGLESEEQLRLLRHEGCDEAQGYFWGRPMAHPLPHYTAEPAPAQTRIAAVG